MDASDLKERLIQLWKLIGFVSIDVPWRHPSQSKRQWERSLVSGAIRRTHCDSTGESWMSLFGWEHRKDKGHLR